MTLDIHALANAPGYGKAEAALKKAGKWELTPQEKMQKMMEQIICAISDAQNAINDAEYHIDDSIRAFHKLSTAMEATHK